MNRTETLAVMSILKAAYPAYYRDMKRQDAEAVVNLWAEMLADYPANLVAAAVKSHIASDRKGFPPHIGAIMLLVTISANIAVIYLRIQYGGFYALPIFQMERCLERLITLAILMQYMRVPLTVWPHASRLGDKYGIYML